MIMLPVCCVFYLAAGLQGLVIVFVTMQKQVWLRVAAKTRSWSPLLRLIRASAESCVSGPGKLMASSPSSKTGNASTCKMPSWAPSRMGLCYEQADSSRDWSWLLDHSAARHTPSTSNISFFGNLPEIVLRQQLFSFLLFPELLGRQLDIQSRPTGRSLSTVRHWLPHTLSVF